jgi:hypothetical protein
VVSDYDSPVPPVGGNFITSGTLVNAYMTSPVIAVETGTRFLCSGWLGEGSVPDLGTTITVTFNLDVPSTITWQWKTQYYLDASANPPEGGSVMLAGSTTPATDWYDEGDDVGVLAVPLSSYQFENWSGDLSGTDNPTTVTMTMPKDVVANFSLTPTPTPTPTPTETPTPTPTATPTLVPPYGWILTSIHDKAREASVR